VGGDWGAPLAKYRKEAAVRLKRVGGRPYLVSQNGGIDRTEEWVRSVLPDAANFTCLTVSTSEIFGEFPNKIAKHPHTDRWPLVPSTFRTRTWTWMNSVVKARSGDERAGE
jgi:hypothetical protein